MQQRAVEHAKLVDLLHRVAVGREPEDVRLRAAPGRARRIGRELGQRHAADAAEDAGRARLADDVVRVDDRQARVGVQQ